MAEHDTPTAAEVQEYLKGMSYPASADDLRRQAKENGVAGDPRVMEFFERIPNKSYESVTDVSVELSSYSDIDDEEGRKAA